jgi:hypothetical protein
MAIGDWVVEACFFPNERGIRCESLVYMVTKPAPVSCL